MRKASETQLASGQGHFEAIMGRRLGEASGRWPTPRRRSRWAGLATAWTNRESNEVSIYGG